MSCTVEERQRVRRAARAIRDEVATESVDVLSPSASQYGEWTLDAVLRDADGVPPEVLRELALAGLTLQPTPSQERYEHVAATV
ncbi:hypothetical protein [Haloarcula argentinensis]|uniref:Uncharacterized protein n=1 Tax=Haloarcula argentinensis TaxID=43776 RepID=A0A830FHC7_HALAR|nr:hypothetical protein [Haloarcula argentinensis]GGM50170.1 hypothetical protein GCM10009006_34210 [Haloarcula argentinensis]